MYLPKRVSTRASCGFKTLKPPIMNNNIAPKIHPIGIKNGIKKHNRAIGTTIIRSNVSTIQPFVDVVGYSFS